MCVAPPAVDLTGSFHYARERNNIIISLRLSLCVYHTRVKSRGQFQLDLFFYFHTRFMFFYILTYKKTSLFRTCAEDQNLTSHLLFCVSGIQATIHFTATSTACRTFDLDESRYPWYPSWYVSRYIIPYFLLKYMSP